MFERFTPEARQVVVLAQDEARSLHHGYIGTEHILLGVMRQEESASAGVLTSLGLSLDRARADVLRIVGAAEEVSPGQIPFTPRAKKVLELALREALSLGHDWIGPEHIVLGLAGETEGVAARILREAGAGPEQVRNEVIKILPALERRAPGPPMAGALAHASRWPVDTAWLDALAPALDPLARQIRQELGRNPDLGDLLLALACAPEMVAGRALRELGIEPDALWGTIERVRQESVAELEELERRTKEVREAKEKAIRERSFDEAARLRDEESELAARQRSRRSVGPEVLAEIRRRLGLPKQPD